MLEAVKNIFLNKDLKSKKVVIQKEITSLQRAKTIGIIAHITDEDSYKKIFSIFTKLQAPSKTVLLIGYINEKTVPFYCLQQLSADYFCQSNLNWFGKPNMVQIDDFTLKDFDILIDFSHENLQPLRYILTLSHAKFIVGSHLDHKDLYDLYFETEYVDDYKLLENVNIYTKKLVGDE